MTSEFFESLNPIISFAPIIPQGSTTTASAADELLELAGTKTSNITPLTADMPISSGGSQTLVPIATAQRSSPVPVPSVVIKPKIVIKTCDDDVPKAQPKKKKIKIEVI